jgi:hypothetical protein
MSKRKKIKPGYLGPAFYEWLKHLELVEAVGLGGGARSKHFASLERGGYAFNDALFKPINPDSAQDTVRDMLPVDAWLAERVRSSHKYTLDLATLREARDRYSDEFDAILETMPVEAPFPNTTVCFTGLGPDDIVVNVSKLDMRVSDRGNPKLQRYDALELTRENPYFYSASMAFVRTRGPAYNRKNHVDLGSNPDNLKPTKLSNVPVEVHFNADRNLEDCIFLNAIAEGIVPTERGKDLIEMVRILLLNFFASFHLSSVLRTRQPGRAPDVDLKGPALHKHRARPPFEHWVVEFEVDRPEPQQTGIEREQPKKRRHEVRGFLRTYKNPIKHGRHKGKTQVWVDGHWRGDARLGIVKRDEEVVLHDEDPSN